MSRPVEGQATALLREPFDRGELLAFVDKLLQTGHRDGQAPMTCP